MKMTRLILASGSPRRLELLSAFDFDIEVIKPQVDEIIDKNLEPGEIVKSLAMQKGEAVAKRLGSTDCPVLSADTIVVESGEILGKPADRADAVRMISRLSGRTHEVFTGVAIFYKGQVKNFFVRSEVVFRDLTQDEIDSYCDLKEPYDKAGAYAIQGTAAFMIRSANGSYSNIIGLPVCEVAEALRDLKIQFGVNKNG